MSGLRLFRIESHRSAIIDPPIVRWVLAPTISIALSECGMFIGGAHASKIEEICGEVTVLIPDEAGAR